MCNIVLKINYIALQIGCWCVAGFIFVHEANAEEFI